MTIQKTLELILKRLEAVEARLNAMPQMSDFDVYATREDIAEIQSAVDYGLTEIADDIRRRERLEWAAGARAAMGKVS